MLPPDEIRHKIIELLQERKRFSGPGYVVGMVACVLVLLGLARIPALMQRWNLDWTYSWFTKSSWNRQELYAFYFFFVVVPLVLALAALVRAIRVMAARIVSSVRKSRS